MANRKAAIPSCTKLGGVTSHVVSNSCVNPAIKIHTIPTKTPTHENQRYAVVGVLSGSGGNFSVGVVSVVFLSMMFISL